MGPESTGSAGGIPGVPGLEDYSLKHFSLMNALLGVLNHAGVGTPEHVLARYLLEHFAGLRQLNVYDLATQCAVSRSTVRRFCRLIGFETFTEVKRAAFEQDLHWHGFVGRAWGADPGRYLAAEVSRAVEDARAADRQGAVGDVAEDLRAAHEVVVVASDFSGTGLLGFQQSMACVGTVVQVLTESSGGLALLGTLRPRDLVLVLSVTGRYARAARGQLEDVPARKILVTASRDPDLAAGFDRDVRLGARGAEDHHALSGRYLVAVFLDLVYGRYLRVQGV